MTMSTRATTYIVEESTPIAAMYTQSDGGLWGVGKMIAGFCTNRRVVDGHGAQPEEINGLGDLGARLFTMLKGDPEQVGNCYLIPPLTPDEQNFGYFVSIRDNNIHINVTENGEHKYAGSPEGLLQLCLETA